MLPIPFDDEEIPEGFGRTLWAEHQTQYETLPSITGPEGEVRARWRLTEDERRAILDGANIELAIWTFGSPLQPHNLKVQGMEYQPNQDRGRLQYRYVSPRRG